MKLPIAAGTAVAAIAFACVSVPGAGAAGKNHGNPTAYLDLRPGDGGAAPDIIVTAVSNTLSGTLEFAVAFANRSAFAPDDILQLVIDADRNPATGDENGFDYIIQVHGAETVMARLLPGGQFEIVDAPSLRGTFERGAEVIDVAASDLGNTTSFRFFIHTQVGESSTPFDDTPDGDALWEYALKTPHIDRLQTTTTPRQARAGAALKVAVASAVLASGETVTLDSVACRATIAGRRVAGKGAGGCSFTLPRSARGKSLRIVVTARFRDQTRPFTYVVRVR